MRRALAWVVLGIAFAGCGAEIERSRNAARTSGGSTKNFVPQRGLAAGAYQPDSDAEGAEDGGNDPAAGQAATPDRKIVYEAELSVVVDNFSKVETDIPALVRQFQGYLADVEIDRTQGEYRTGRWEARVPVERFDAFLEAAAALGVPERRRQTSQDVTEEFVDLEARIANQQRLEERILALLDNAEDKIKDVIEVERELGRVRGEIERMQGRLRYLTDRTSLTTVTIIAREERDYIPPAAPSFTSRVGRAWEGSLQSLRVFAEGAAVTAVYVGPWLIVLAVVLIPPTWYLRRRIINSRKASGESATRR